MARYMVRAVILHEDEELFVFIDIDDVFKKRVLTLRDEVKALRIRHNTLNEVRFNEVGVLNTLRNVPLEQLGDLDEDAYADFQDCSWCRVPDDFPVPKFSHAAEGFVEIANVTLCMMSKEMYWRAWNVPDNTVIETDTIPIDGLVCPIHGPDDADEPTCIECVARG